MRYWFDTEFIEDGNTIDLISIGIVAEDGREFYAQKQSCVFENADDWVARNVFPHLIHFDMGTQGRSCSEVKEYGGRCSKVPECAWLNRHAIRDEILKFCDPDKYEKPEFWAYYADYDWVVLCQLFGRMIHLPKSWPMYCRDIKQWCDMLGNPKLPEQGKGEHHALADARWNKIAWEFLNARTV